MEDNPQNSTEYMLGRIEAKVDTFIAAQAKAEARMDDHDERISKLERGRAYGLGFAAAIGSAVSAVGAFLFPGLHH
jgi:hypothetical protein